MLTQIKAYAWQLLAALFAGLVLTQTLRLHAAQIDAANTRAATANTLRTIVDLTAKATQAVRARETQWAQAQEENAHEAKTQLTAARADADDARRAGDRLQQRVTALVAAARAGAANPGAEPAVAPAGDPIGVLADVFSRADKRAGILAEYADAARIAGAGCERDYDALTGREADQRP